MMRGARICPTPAAVAGKGLVMAMSARCQSDAAPAATDADAEKVAKLTNHVRESGGGMDKIRGRMGGNRNSNNNNNNGEEAAQRVEDPTAVMQRLYRDAVRDTDPLGGQYHKDYFRDPSKGYAPQHAPRNFAEGGRVDYHAPRTGLAAEMSAAARQDGDHAALRYRQEAAASRAATRAMSAAEFAAYAAEEGKLLQDHATTRQRNGVRANEAFTAAVSAHSKATYVPDQYEIANRRRATTGARAGTSIDEAVKQQSLAEKQRSLDVDLETFRNIHGLREQERHEAELARRFTRRAPVNFDADRAIAGKSNKLYGQSQFDPLLPSSTMAEAQANLRKHALPDEAALYAKGFSRNTVQEQPLSGEQLTQSLLGTKRLNAAKAESLWETARREALGMGRQGPLSQESGPDRRKQRLHKNDERLLSAQKFLKNAYHKQLSSHSGEAANAANPHDRNGVANIGSLLNNKFDIDRRGALIAQGKADPLESTTMHYGTPMAEQLDAFVRINRNAKGERPTDYFTPFPSRQDMTLSTAYRDLEGFPLMKVRPDFLEWELFCRYRAHHQQRRRLALLHGLEPVPNETIQERDARRERLDQLCEATPFDGSLMTAPKKGELPVTADGLRRHFGAYFLPSPTIVKSILFDPASSLPVIEQQARGVDPKDPLAHVADGREHLLSARYVNKLAQKDGFLLRIRGPSTEIRNHMPEPSIEYLPESVTATFTEKEFALYQKYINKQMTSHEQQWAASSQKRRWISERNAWSSRALSSDVQMAVVDAIDATTGVTTVVPLEAFKNALKLGSSVNGVVTLDGVPYKVDPSSARLMNIVTVSFEDGSSMIMDEKDYHSRPLAVEADPNTPLNYGLPSYHYNRINYIETQDAIWEEGAYKGEEGWTLASERDGLREGLPILARRPVKRADGSVLSAGETQRAEIVQFQNQPFFNPNPRHITVRFAVDGTVESVPLTSVYLWQLTRNGPERAVPDESRKPTPTLKRYVDFADPKGEKAQPAHFLDRYRVASSEDPFRSVKQITDVDLWTINDESRAENVRPLTIANRKNYISGRYFPYFTPWDLIVGQEMEAPLIAEQIRTTGAGDSFLFAPNRYWRWKRRGHGYVQNSPHEVRDMFRYIDQITPWKKAQKVRNLWEVRQHHPISKFHRPEVAMHRNNPGLLPSHMWELDKKSGKVRTLKDSVATYQTLEPYPSWVQL